LPKFANGLRIAALVGVSLFSLDMAQSTAHAGFFEELFGNEGRSAAPAPPPSRRGGGYAEDYWSRKSPDNTQLKRARNGESGRITGGISAGPGEWAKAHSMRKRAPSNLVASLEAADQQTSAGRFLCVRTCDGAVVSLAKRGGAMDGAQHGAPRCDNACPGAEVHLYTLPPGVDEISNATEAGTKSTYADLVARVKADDNAKSSCTCGSIAAKADVGVSDFLADATLRSGDVVATTEGLRIFQGGRSLPHRTVEFLAFDATRGRFPKSTHGALEAMNRTLMVRKNAEPNGSSVQAEK